MKEARKERDGNEERIGEREVRGKKKRIERKNVSVGQLTKPGGRGFDTR
jgi:hypothetical protein